MNTRLIQAEAKANFSRFNPNSNKGFYESYFIRANHPTEKKAFWIRYTVFAPKENPQKNIGELWAIYFDGKDIYPAKTEFSIENCKFPNKNFYVELGENSLNSAQAIGKTESISWKLKFSTKDNALFLLPLNYYSSPFPKAKSIVSQPFASFKGHLKIGSIKVKIDNWIGSQNHNWGEKHTDYYAWGQVAGFDNSPDTFLELITAKLLLAGIETPFLTILVLRHKGKEYQINSPGRWYTNKGTFEYFNWEFECKTKDIEIKGRIKATSTDFVGLRYHNPSGGFKNCLNSKVASCELQIKEKSKAGMPQALYSADKCAFEILTNEGQEHHGIKINF